MSTTAWGRSLATTIVKHLKDVEEAVLRERPVSAYVLERGRMLFNQGGEDFDWRAKYRLHNVKGNTGETARQFERINRWKIAKLEYRGKQVTDAVTKKEMLANQDSDAKIIDLQMSIVQDMIESLNEHVGEQWYKDGEASGNEDDFHGIETMMGQNGTVNVGAAAPSLASRAANQADLFGYPNSTYANLNCTLANYGGVQTAGIWPDGQANPQADFWSPNILMYDSTHADLGSGSTFADQGVEAIRALRIACQRNKGSAGEVDFCTLDRALYRKLLNQLDDKERVLVSAELGLRSFGFRNVVEVDGLECTPDYGIPPDVGYMWNIDYMDVRSMQDSFIASDENEWDIDSQSMKYVVDLLGNIKFASPRCFGKLMQFSDFDDT